MKQIQVFVQNQLAGYLTEHSRTEYSFEYLELYVGPPISFTMPVLQRSFQFDQFPPFFDGLLPEGVQLEALLKRQKIDQHDYLTQLLTVGEDLVGDVTVRKIP